MTAPLDLGARHATLPRVSLLLLGAAIIDGAIVFWSRYRVDGYLYATLPIVVSQLLSVMPLVLAAGIVAGLERWVRGRAWLTAAAVMYAASAVVDVAGQLGMSVVLTSELPPAQQSVTATSSLALLESSVLMIATLLAAAGLWRGAAGRARAPWPAGFATAIAILVTLAAILTAAVMLSGLPSRGTTAVSIVSGAAYVLIVLSSIPLALLGAVAIRRLPDRHLLPELLIGLGSMTAAIAFWVLIAPIVVASVLGPQVVPPGVVVVASAAQLVGISTLAFGFFAARFVPSGAIDGMA